MTSEYDTVLIDINGFSLYSVGPLPEKNDPIYTHNHKYMELTYVVSGKVTNTVNGVKHELKKGDYYFINPGDFHHDITEDYGDEKGEIIVMTFYPSFINPIFEKCTSLNDLLFNFHIYLNPKTVEVSPRPLSTYFHDENGYIEQLFVQSLKEYYNPKIGSREIIRNNIVNILITLLRERDMLTDKLSDDAFSIIYEYMQNHYMDDITLDVVAKLVNFSPQYISLHFAEKTGDSFRLALKKIRINNACKLLLETNKAIDEIAGLVGYKDLKTFYKIFREITDTTPYQYKKKLLNKADQPS